MSNQGLLRIVQKIELNWEKVCIKCIFQKQASIGTNNDKCALLNVGDNKSEEDGINNPPSNDDDDALHHHQQQNPLHLFTSSEFDLSSAHRSCPDLSLSLSLESFIRTFERERKCMNWEPITAHIVCFHPQVPLRLP